jgi:hypothetical protein
MVFATRPARFLAMPETRLGNIAGTALDAQLVARWMQRTRSRRVVLLLDCCFMAQQSVRMARLLLWVTALAALAAVANVVAVILVGGQ